MGVIYTGIVITLALPLAVDQRFIFPYVFTKALVFHLAIDIMLLAYLIMLCVNSFYKPRLNFLFYIISAFVAWAFIASYFGPDFYFSFWGDLERGEGLIMWLYLLVYFIILSSVIQNIFQWMIFFDISLFASLMVALFALGQVFGMESILNTTGERVASTIGNPAFLATYLIFQMALAAYLFFKRNFSFHKIYYGALFFLFLFILILTRTRGAAIGVFFGIIFGIGAWWFLEPAENRKRIAKIFLPIFFILIALFSVLFINRQSEWARRIPAINNLVSITLTERTAQTRLVTWQAAWLGWREKFFLGHGLESFSYVFDQRFPPIIYEDEGSQVWFDRAHNLIFDRGVTTGIVGLALYLIFILYPLFFFLRKYKRDNEKKVFVAIFSGLIVAFFIQDLLVFELVTTYAILFFVWAFFGSIMYPKNTVQFSEKKKTAIWQYAVCLIYFLVLWPLMKTVDIAPARASAWVSEAMNYDPKTTDFFKIVDTFKQGLAIKTHGLPELLIHYIDFVGTQVAQVGEVVPKAREVVEYTDNQVEALVKMRPNDTRSILVAMRNYNYTYAAMPEKKVERLQKALSYFPDLTRLSPERPQVYREAGYSYLYLYRYYKERKEQEKADEAYREAEKYLNMAVEKNPEVLELYFNLVMIYLNAEKNDKVQEVVETMDKKNLAFRDQPFIGQLIKLAIGNKNYHWSAYFTQEYLRTWGFKTNEEKLPVMIDLALSYAYDGEDEKAIETAQEIKELGDDTQKKQVDIFIADVKAGKYKQVNSQ